MEKQVREILTKLFSLLQIEAEFDIEEKDGEIQVVLHTNEGGIVIGRHGEILESLQLIASLCVSKEIGSYVRVSIEVDNYKKNRSEYLEKLALDTKEKVLSEQREIPLSHLKSWERRVIHLLLSEDSEVVSESVGEGRDRTLVIKPRE